MPVSASRRRRALPAGRLLALLCGIGAALLWLGFGLRNPYAVAPAGSQWLAGLFALLGLACAALGWWRRPELLALGALLSLTPVGIYLLGTPGLYAWIGVANLGCLVAAALIRMGQPRA